MHRASLLQSPPSRPQLPFRASLARARTDWPWQPRPIGPYIRVQGFRRSRYSAPACESIPRGSAQLALLAEDDSEQAPIALEPLRWQLVVLTFSPRGLPCRPKLLLPDRIGTDRPLRH